MIQQVVIAGSGGQGVMLLGKVLAQSAMLEAKQVTWFPAYGAEVRGGTSYCMVTIADREIGSPYVSQADILIILNQPSLGKFKDLLRPGGLLIINSSLVRLKGCGKARILEFPFSDIALKLGNIKVANMVALGCLVAGENIVKANNVIKVFKAMAPAGNPGILEINRRALEEGMKLIHG